MNLDQLQADADAISKASPAIRKFAEDAVAYLKAQAAPAPAPAPAPQPTPAPTPTSSAKGIALEQFGGANISTWQSLSLYDFLIVGLTQAADAAKQPGQSFVYFDPWTALAAYNQGVTYQQAQAGNWFARDSAGNLIGAYGNPPTAEALLDVTIPAYRTQLVANIRAALAAYPTRVGCYLDNILPDYMSEASARATVYPTTAAWQTAILNLVSVVAQAMHADGRKLAVNMSGYLNPGDNSYNDGSFYQSWAGRIAAAGSDGIQLEYWMEQGEATALRNNGSSQWPCFYDGWLQIMDAVNAAGAHFLPTMIGASTNTQAMRFGRASFLLGFDGSRGGIAYANSPPYTGGDPWNLVWTATIGQPSAARVHNANGTYFRQYTAGWVAVNPTLSAQTVNGVTVPATDAVIHAG